MKVNRDEDQQKREGSYDDGGEELGGAQMQVIVKPELIQVHGFSFTKDLTSLLSELVVEVESPSSNSIEKLQQNHEVGWDVEENDTRKGVVEDFK